MLAWVSGPAWVRRLSASGVRVVAATQTRWDALVRQGTTDTHSARHENVAETHDRSLMQVLQVSALWR